MKKAMGLLAGLLLITSCGGEKNDVASAGDTNSVLAVRTTEDGSQTQVAVIDGDLNTPEEAEEAAQNAQWTDLDSFNDDGKLGGVEFVSDSEFEDEFGALSRGFDDDFDDYRDSPRRNRRGKCGKRGNKCDRYSDHDDDRKHYRKKRRHRKRGKRYSHRYDRRRKYFRIWASWPQPRYRVPERYPKQSYSCEDDYFWWSSSNGCYRPVSYNQGYEYEVGYTFVIRMKIRIRQKQRCDNCFDDDYQNCHVVLYR